MTQPVIPYATSPAQLEAGISNWSHHDKIRARQQWSDTPVGRAYLAGQQPAPAAFMPPPVVVQQAYAPAPPPVPMYAKTTINHGMHLIIDLCTFGLWIPVHITLALLVGRKTRIR